MKPIKVNRRQIVLASLVLALGTAVYLNWQFSPKNMAQPTSGKVSASPDEGNLDLNNFLHSEKDKKKSKYFENARSKRQDAREKSLKAIEEILANNEIDGKTKSNLTKELSACSQWILKETNIENLINAKYGDKFDNCIATINEKECSLIISPKDSFGQSDADILSEIVRTQTGFGNDQIKIVAK